MSNGMEQIFLPSSAMNLPFDMEMFERAGNGAPAPTINIINLENVSDFSKVCRVCATVTDLVMPIFSGQGLRINLADKIKRHLPIKVTANDMLPVVVCYQCTSTLLATHELVACSLQAEAALHTAHEQRMQRPAASRRALDNGEGTSQEPPDECRQCEYCPLLVEGALYNGHLLGRHAQLVFHCNECDSYVARRRFLHHMTGHAAQYDARGRLHMPKPILIPAPAPAPRAPAPGPARRDAGPAPAPGSAPAPPQPVRTPEIERDADPDPEPTLDPARETPAPPEPDLASVESDPVPDQRRVPPESEDGSSGVDGPTESRDSPAESDRRSTGARPKPVRRCPHCPKTYTAASSYFYHLKYTHAKSREHECVTCGRRFGTRGALREHAVLHDSARSLECDECGKRFRSRAGLYVHAQTHGDERDRKFECTECGRAFRWRAELRRHSARHSTERAHACPCGRAFAVRADLLRHARTHAPGRAALACPEGCRATFAQPRYLRAHLARRHGPRAPDTDAQASESA